MELRQRCRRRAISIGGICVSNHGLIYGTTLGGGSYGSSGFGTFFTLTPTSGIYKETVISLSGVNGEYPFAGPTFYSPGGTNKGTWLIASEAGGANGKGAVSDSVKLTNWSGRLRALGDSWWRQGDSNS